MSPDGTRPILPWRALANLPRLGVVGMLAKLDTGARGTVIHATDIDRVGDLVSFVLHPWPRAPQDVVRCEAALADRRVVTSSNGAGEERVFIRTGLTLAGLPEREVEVSLSARPTMAFRMLVGREALAAWSALVDPADEGGTAAPALR